MAEHPLVTYRKVRNLTQLALARELHVSRTTVARWECGDRKVGKRKLPEVSEKTGIDRRALRPDLDELLSGAAA